MLKTFIIGLLLGSLAYDKYNAHLEIAKQKLIRLNAVENAFNTGCYSFAQNQCSKIQIEDDGNDCWALALHCEEAGKTFRNWIEGKK